MAMLKVTNAPPPDRRRQHFGTWRLSPETIEAGRKGVAAAREAMRRRKASERAPSDSDRDGELSGASR